MKKTLSYIVFADMIFILLLALSGLFGGVFGNAVYYAAFLIPILLTAFLVKIKRLEFSSLGIKISRENFLLTLPTAAPILALVFLISWITSILLSAIGQAPVFDVSGNIVLVIFLNAFLPALFEEVLFRFIPISLLLPYGKRGAVLITSILFSLIHCSLFQIPYAFVAGTVFAVIDIAFGSIIPSLILHFLNNTVSIIWMRGSGNDRFVLIYISVLLGATFLSGVFIAICRKRYIKSIGEVFSDGRKPVFTVELALLVFSLLFIAVANLFV